MKAVGYILSLAGLAIIGLSSRITKFSFMASIPPVYTVLAGVVLIAIGLVLVMSESSSTSKVKQASEEVPIYEGEGKKRRIVGYKKA